jgi:hypothetical protein
VTRLGQSWQLGIALELVVDMHTRKVNKIIYKIIVIKLAVASKAQHMMHQRQ